MTNFIKFLIKSSEQDLLWFLRFDALIYNHYNSEWECHRLRKIYQFKKRNISKILLNKS